MTSIARAHPPIVHGVIIFPIFHLLLYTINHHHSIIGSGGPGGGGSSSSDDTYRAFDDDSDPDEDRVDGMAWDYEHDLPVWACHGRRSRDEKEQERDDEELELLRQQFVEREGATRGDRRFFARMVRKYAKKKARRDRHAEERRLALAAKQARDRADAAFWVRQRRCGSQELSLGGVGCYLHWHPRKLQREVSRRNLKTKRRPRETAGTELAWDLLEDDERRLAAAGSGAVLMLEQGGGESVAGGGAPADSSSSTMATPTATTTTTTTIVAACRHEKTIKAKPAR